MAGPPLTRKKDATYHMLQATAKWEAFIKGLGAVVTKSAAARASQDAQRRRETTYARGEKGGS